MATIRRIELKNGNFKYRIDVKFFDPNENKIRAKSKTFYPPKDITLRKANLMAEQEAENFEKSIYDILNSNHPKVVDDFNITFKDFATKWLNDSKIEKGITYYEEKIDKVEYLIKEVGNYKVKELNPAIIQDMYNRIDSRKKVISKVKAVDNISSLLRKNGWNYKKLIDANVGETTYKNALMGYYVSEKWAIKFSNIVNMDINKLFVIERKYQNYSFETNSKIKKTMHLILGRAVKYGIIDRNFSSPEFIDLPKCKKKKIDVMNEKEIKIFYDTVLNLDNIVMKTALLVALLTGFRRGEIAGLKWDDVDLNDKTITVNRSIRKSKELGQFVKDPKTESSNRTITIPDELVNQLKEYKTCQDEKKKKLGKDYNKDNYLFTNMIGGMCNLDILESWMKKVLVKANLSHHTLHSLRHTNITLQIAAGVPIVTVASRAGHSKTSTTTDIYAYSLIGSDKLAASAISNALNNKDISDTDETKSSLLEFKKAKEEMIKLGFESMDEYIDYKKYISSLNEKKENNVKEIH